MTSRGWIGLWIFCAVTTAAAQPVDSTDFIERARAATEKYKELDAAIAAGYRKVGPDMPNMGEHWIHIRRVFEAPVDPARPSTLTYLRIAGVPVLTGVAYTAPVLVGEAVPPSPVQGAEWHFHVGSIHEELMGHEKEQPGAPVHDRHERPAHDADQPGASAHDHHEHHSSEATGPRLAMLHAWIWSPNPSGTFTADHWGLPYLRLGLLVPRHVDPDAARALFLLDGGVTYYASLLEAELGEDRPDARRRLEEARLRVETLVARNAPDADLAALWRGLWPELWSCCR